jgi:hypothetical protein
MPYWLLSALMAANPTSQTMRTGHLGISKLSVEFAVISAPPSERFRRAVYRLDESYQSEISSHALPCDALTAPYSADFNPIEQALLKVKALMRHAKSRTRATLIKAMGRALEAVTARDRGGFFDRCGYRTLGQLLRGTL